MTKREVVELLSRRLATSIRLKKANTNAARIARYEGKAAAFQEAIAIVEQLEDTR